MSFVLVETDRMRIAQVVATEGDKFDISDDLQWIEDPTGLVSEATHDWDGVDFVVKPSPPPPTADEQLRQKTLDLAFIVTKLVDNLIAKGVIAAGDFDTETRQEYLDMKVLVDNLRP